MSDSPELRPNPVPDLTIQEAFVPAATARRVLVYAPLAYSTPHFETDLEIAQRHLDLGDTVELVLCDGELSSCQLNPMHEARRCLQCISRNLQGAAQLSRPVPVHGLVSALTTEDQAALARVPRHFATQTELRDYCFDGFDVGMASLSSIIDFARTTALDTRAYAGLIQRTLTAAVTAFLATKRLIATQHYDRVYIYNGRWSMMRSAVRACEQLGVEYYTHERGSDFRKFALYRNSLPHDKVRFSQRTAAAWQHAATRPQTAALAEAFFLERRKRVEKAWFSFVKAQETGRTPADWDRAARRIVFFTSSEFEFAAIGGEAIGRIYPDQVTGLRHFAPALARRSPDAHLWVRVHPNDQSPITTQRWIETAAALRNVTLIRPDEKIDSYAMMEGADRVLTFGSTIGIEATYWGRPAICADYSFYDGQDAQYEAGNEEELLELLCRPALPPKAREQAVRFGYYLNTYGEPFVHFSTEQISDYEFKSPFRGRCLKPDFADLAQRLVALHQAGEDDRVRMLAPHYTAVAPADARVQAVVILTHLRSRELTRALDALEKVPAGILELVLKHAGKPLLDATQQLARAETHEAFRAGAARLGAIMQRVPSCAPIGTKLAAMAGRGAHPAATT